MADPLKINRAYPPPLPAETAAVQSNNRAAQVRGTQNPSGASFSEMLRVRQGVAEANAAAASVAPGGTAPAPDAIRFSAHAQTRLQSRQIALQPSHLERLQGAVQRAAGKGSRDALVLMDDLAMVVSVTNRTVVTVVDKENLKQNVFTNIDSAVIA